MRKTFLPVAIFALAFVMHARPGFTSYDVTGGNAVIGAPDDTTDGIRFLDAVDRTATVTVDKAVGSIAATPTMSVSTATNNMGTLTLQGNTTLSADIGETGFSLLAVNVGANGTSSTVFGDIYAVSTNITGTGNVTVNGGVNGKLAYDGNGLVILADNQIISDAITNDTGTNNQGTLTLAGRGTVFGQVGLAGEALLAINAGVAGSSSVFFSDIYTQDMNIVGAGLVVLNGNLNGALNFQDDGALTLTGNTTISGGVSNDTLNDGTGTLTLSGNGAVTGQVGTLSAALLAVNAGEDGTSATFLSDIYAHTMNITGTGVVVLNGDVNGNLIYKDNGIAILANNTRVDGTVTNEAGANRQGTLTMDGSGEVTGQVGIPGAVLLAVNAGANGSSSTFANDVYTQRMNVTGTGTVALGGDLNGSLSYGGDGTVTLANNITVTGSVSNDTMSNAQGTLTLASNAAVYGQVGADGASLKAVNAGADGSSSTFLSGVYAQNMNITGTGDVSLNATLNGALRYSADGSVTLANNTTVTGSVTNITGSDGQGTLSLGGTGEIDVQVGSAGASLKAVNAGVAGSSSTFSSDVYAQDMNIVGTGAVTLEGDLYGDLTYGADGVVTLANNATVTGAVINNTGTDGRGTLTLAENAVLGVQVGAASAVLRAVNAGADGSTSTFSNDIYTQSMNVTGTGDVVLVQDLNGVLNYLEDGTVTLTGNNTITGAVINGTGTDQQGTLVLAGSEQLDVQVGAADALLFEVNAGANGAMATFTEAVYAQTMNVTGTGTVALNGDLNAALSYDASGIVLVADNVALNGTVTNDTGSNYNGDLIFSGTHTTGGTIGIVGGNSLGLISINQGTFTMAHDMSAAQVLVDQSATLALSGDRTIASGALDVANGSTVDLGQNTLTLGTGGVNFASGTNLNLTVSSASVYGRIVQAAADAVIAPGTTININVTGNIANGTTLYVVDGNAGTSVAGGLTVVDNNMIVNFIVSAVAGPDLILVARVNYDPAAFGGSTGAVAHVLETIEGQTVSADMTTVFTELHNATSYEIVSNAAMQMRPYEGTAIVDQTRALSSNGRRAAMTHMEMVRNNGVKDPETVRRQEEISRALDEYEDPMMDIGEDKFLEAEIWAQGVGSMAEQSARGGVQGYSAMAKGMIFGIDTLKLNRMIFGVAGGFSSGSIDPDQFGLGDINIRHYPLIIYAELHGIRPWRVDAALSVARNRYQTQRSMRFGSIDRIARGMFNGQEYGLSIEAAYDLATSSPWKLTPSAMLDYSQMTIDGYTERDADALNLRVESQDYTHLRSGFGLAASTVWTLARMRAIPQVYGRVYHEWLAPSIKTRAAFEGTDTFFETTAMSSARNMFETGMSLDLALRKEMSLRFNYDAEFSQGYASNLLSAQFKNKF